MRQFHTTYGKKHHIGIRQASLGQVSPAEELVGLTHPSPEIPIQFAQGFLQAMIQTSLQGITTSFKR